MTLKTITKQPFDFKVIFLSSLFFMLCCMNCSPKAQPSGPPPGTLSPVKNNAAKNNTQPQTMGSATSMRVLWTVSEYKLGPNATWNDEEARRMLFKPLDMDANSITFDGQKCNNITFKKETIKIGKGSLEFFHATPQMLGVTDDAIEVIKTDCSLPGFGEYLRLKDRRLITRLSGVFFYFEPNINY